jgi:hypothetical protein
LKARTKEDGRFGSMLPENPIKIICIIFLKKICLGGLKEKIN